MARRIQSKLLSLDPIHLSLRRFPYVVSERPKTIHPPFPSDANSMLLAMSPFTNILLS